MWFLHYLFWELVQSPFSSDRSPKVQLFRRCRQLPRNSKSCSGPNMSFLDNLTQKGFGTFQDPNLACKFHWKRQRWPNHKYKGYISYLFQTLAFLSWSVGHIMHAVQYSYRHTKMRLWYNQSITFEIRQPQNRFLSHTSSRDQPSQRFSLLVGKPQTSPNTDYPPSSVVSGKRWDNPNLKSDQFWWYIPLIP